MVDRLKGNFVVRLYRHYIVDSIIIARTQGFKALLKQRGWKFFMIIFMYYLLRDSIIYILIPFMIARGFVG